jgi:glycosyltransferase involved in cell wall biosynthesis
MGQSSRIRHMKPDSVISVVTISYNQAPYLEECIRSVFGQDYPNIEYIVVDPGSSDGSREIIKSFEDRITRVVFEPDKGPADGLNKGFMHATGAILGYINADDRYVPGALRYVADFFASHPETDVLCGANRVIDRNGQSSVRKRTSDDFDLTRYAAGICTINQQATFFRRSAFQRAGGFNPENRIAWDGELLVDMALAGCKFTSVRKILGEFRVYDESITGSGKYRHTQLDDLRRLSAKMQNAHVRIYSPAETVLRRLAYKLNLKRHLGYLLVK